MKKQKIRFLITLLSIALGCFSVGLVGCDNDNPEASQGIAYGDITFASQTVDVADAPDFVVEIGDNKITKVLLDGVALPINHYLVKNGYFAFAYDNFYEMGLGVHNVEVVFEQGTKQFTITVKDVQDPKFSVQVEASYEVGDRTLSKAERLNDYQAYDLSYGLTKDGVDVPMTDEGDRFSVSFLEVGDYVYTISVTRNGATTTNTYPIRVSDSFEYLEGKNYVSEAHLSYFSGTVSCEWDENRGAIKATEYFGISNELIHRARYAGDNYLELVVSGDIVNPSYITFPYKASDKKGVSLGAECYATDGLQTILIDMSEIENKDGVTEVAKGNSGLPVYVYSAKFREKSLTDNVNYAAHAYKKANIWTATDGDGTPWDYRVGDYMELWTYETIMVKTSLFKQAIGLGYTHVIYEAENSAFGATLHYNENITATQTKLNESTATHMVAFENGRASVAMNITALANSTSEWIYLAGVTNGKLLTTNLTFTDKPVTNAKVCFNGVETVKQRVLINETFNMNNFSVAIADQTITDVKWTLNGENVDMTNTALVLSEGIHTLKATITGVSGRGSATCLLSVVRPLQSTEIQGELVAEERMNLWQTAGQFTWLGKYVAEMQLSLSAMAIQKAKDDGKNYLEITAIAVDGWLGVDLKPGATTAWQASCSTFDGWNTYVIDLTGITADDGFVKLLWVNQFTVSVTHAEFIDKPVSTNVNYAQWGYASSDIISVTNGAVHSVNDIDELQQIFDPVSEIWKTFMVAKSGTFGIKKSIVEDAIASGFTKVRLDIISTNGATAVYYNNNLSSGEVTTNGSNTANFTNKRTSITIDITNVASISGDYVYLAGTNAGWLVLEGLHFVK